MKFYRQDARHTGHFHFPFAVQFNISTPGINRFIDFRVWCWETYGPGIEWSLFQPFWHSDSTAYQWGWISDESPRRLRILFRDEKQYTFARLKWESS